MNPWIPENHLRLCSSQILNNSQTQSERLQNDRMQRVQVSETKEVANLPIIRSFYKKILENLVTSEYLKEPIGGPIEKKHKLNNLHYNS